MENSQVHPSVIRFHTRFKAYNKRQRDTWESFNLIEYYTPVLRKKLKKKKITPLDYKHLWDGRSRALSAKDTHGAFQSLLMKTNYRR